MAGGKETPRQKMIGMMYLVLTALLALNVSKEVLNSFILINESLETTNQNFEGKNESLYNDFAEQLSQNRTKVKPYYDRAMRVRQLSDSVTDYIESLKRHLIIRTDKRDSAEAYQFVQQYNDAETPEDKEKYKSLVDSVFSLRNVASKDNYDIPTNIMIGPEPSSPKGGAYGAATLAKKLEDYKDKVKAIIGKDTTLLPALMESLEKNFNTDTTIVNASGVKENWGASKFYHIPLAAVVTNLSKMKTDVRNAEADVVKYLYSQIDAKSIKVNKVEPVVLPKSNYVLTGDTFRASVFLAAYDTTQLPTVFYGKEVDSTETGVEIKGQVDTVSVEGGAGRINIPADKMGTQTLHGKIILKGPGGQLQTHPWKTTYQVAEPTTTIAATKMNVFYIGVPNPVSISAPGVPKEAIQASISNGSISKKGDGWIVNVRSPGKAIVNVRAEIDGESQNMGKGEFRCKRIPDPVPYVGGETGSAVIKKAQLNAASGILARMENFDFDVSVKVVSYMFSTTVSGGMLLEETVNSNRFNAKVKNLIAQAKRNSKVYFEQIKVKMPDGTVRELPPVSLKIK